MQINMTNNAAVQRVMPDAVAASDPGTAGGIESGMPQTDMSVHRSVARSGDAAHITNREGNPRREQALLKESAERFNKMSDELNLDVKFAYNDKIDQIYLNVIDKNTGRVIRKLPSEEAMKISESMKELVGALLDKRG